MNQFPSKVDSVIIGAGLSGLACALQCQKANKSFILIEKSNRVGGRIGSVKEDGYLFDLGFQVYNTAYETTNSLLELDKINLNHFKPGAVIHDGVSFQVISDPLRDFGEVFATLFSNITSLSDKFKILKLKRSLRGYDIASDTCTDTTTFQYLKNLRFSDRVVEMFFKPFFSGIFLETELETSSKFFKYVFSTFNSGLASLPEFGMQSIPNDLLDSINRENIFLGKKVAKINNKNEIIFDDNSHLSAKNLVVTGTSHSLISSEAFKYNHSKTLYLSSKVEPKWGKYIHLFPCDRLINNIAIPTSISASYSSNNDNLFSVTIIGSSKPDIELIDIVKQRLSDYYGGGKNDYEFLKCMTINTGTIKQFPGHFDFPKDRKNGLIFAGEHRTHGSIEGAVLSGIDAANSI